MGCVAVAGSWSTGGGGGGGGLVCNVRVYLIDYIFCIIDCHIYQDIFSRIDIMYCRLPYVSRGALPLKNLVVYIYRSRGTMQYKQQLYATKYSAAHLSPIW
jgi:hypothetical protein